MNLREVDLNLLVSFDVLMRIRHVTRAASHLGIGQPAMSACLGRLRELFADPLLVKHGSEMVPTTRALALQVKVETILRDMTSLLDAIDDFEAATSAREFRLRMSDLLSYLLLPALSTDLAQCAPDIQLQVSHLSPDATVDALERNHIEIALSTDLVTSSAIESQPLFTDELVCLCHKDFPFKQKLADLERFVELPQIRISQSPVDDRFVDRQLAQHNLKRHVILTIPHWLAVPEIVASRSLIAILPVSIASRFVTDSRLRTHPLPLPQSSFQWSLYWHKRHSSDHGHRWLRERIAKHGRDLNISNIIQRS